MRNATYLFIGNVIGVFLGLIVLSGCAHGKVFSLATVKAADTIKAADEIKAADKITGVEQATGKASLQVGDKSSTSTKSGRDTTVTNDSAIMERYIASIQANNREVIKLYRYIIGLLMAQMGVLIGLVGWAMKAAMRSNDRDDAFKEKLLAKEAVHA